MKSQRLYYCLGSGYISCVLHKVVYRIEKSQKKKEKKWKETNLYLRFLHQTEQNYWATSLAFLSHWILHLRFYGENQAHAQAFLGHLLDTSGGGIPLRVARCATIITSLLFLFLPPVHCCYTVYSPPERAEGARDGRILSPCSSLLLHRLSSRSVSHRSQSTVWVLPLLLLLISIGIEPAGQ